MARQSQPGDADGLESDATARPAPTVHKDTTRLRLRQPPQEPHERRFLRRFSFHHSGAETVRSGKQSKASVTTILITAIVSFFFGMANNQATDYVRSASTCYAALAQYGSGLLQYVELAQEHHKNAHNPQRETEINSRYGTIIDGAYSKAATDCPVYGPNEYLRGIDVDAWMTSELGLHSCFESETFCGSGPSDLEIDAAATNGRLMGEADQVTKWDFARRGWYALTHLW